MLQHWLRQLTVYFMVSAALLVDCWLWGLTPPLRQKSYVPKAKRPVITRTMYACLAFICKWVKEKAETFEILVYQLCKTKRKKRTQVKRRSSGSRTYLRPAMKRITIAYCMTTRINEKTDKYKHSVHFDTDSRLLRIDNCATRSISPYIKDFINPPIAVKDKKVKGIGGLVSNVMTGTIQWKIEDNAGQVHTIVLPNSLYVKDATARLLSPQHWAQVVKDNKPNPNGTWCATYDDRVVLHWDQQKYQRTIKLDVDGTNVASIRTAPGYNAYQAFCTEAGYEDETTTLCFDTNVISDSESDDKESRSEEKEEKDDEEFQIRDHLY
jgi:hypothetical protein